MRKISTKIINDLINELMQIYDEEKSGSYENMISAIEEKLIVYLDFQESDVNREIILTMFMIVFSPQGGFDDVEGLKNISKQEILDLFYSSPAFKHFLLSKFISIITSPNLVEFLELGDYEVSCSSYKVLTLPDIISSYLEEIYAIYAEEENRPIEYIWTLITTNSDPLNIYQKHFGSLASFSKMKPFIISKLYADGYLYLLQLKEDDYLSEELASYLEEIENRFKCNNIYTWPKDSSLGEFLLFAFYYINTNKASLINSYPNAIEELRLKLKKAHSVMLMDYI